MTTIIIKTFNYNKKNNTINKVYFDEYIRNFFGLFYDSLMNTKHIFIPNYYIYK